MTDIQQWRKKIQPNRVRTPLDLEEVAEVHSPNTTPKRCLKKKMSPYFDLGQTSKIASFHEEAAPFQLPAWPLDELYPEPKAEDQMDSIMCVLMSEPHTRLDVRYNSSLMRIFESYLKLKDEKVELEQKLQESSQAMQSVISKFNMAQKDWEDKKQDYKDEIKRLEVLLAKSSKRGLAEVTLARQDSKLRRDDLSDEDHKETIFEFLEKTNRYSGRFYDNQRATMKPLPLSPSQKERQWSQKLSQKKSMTNIHAELPFGTPPDMRFSLTQASFLEQQAKVKTRRRAVTTSITESDDTFSSFACEGETSPQVLPNPITTGRNATDSDDLTEIARRTNALAQRRNIDPSLVMPQLLNLLDPPRDHAGSTAINGSNALGITAPQPSRKQTSRVVSADNAIAKRKTVVSKASDLLHRLRPQISIDSISNVRGTQRRFSFEPGDDTLAHSTTHGEGILGSVGERILRKSVSLDILRRNPPTTNVADLSPVPSSPTVSTFPSEGRPPSRIPTPVHSLARPRQEREDSASSLLTAIRQPEDAGKRSNSVTSSAYSSPSAKASDANPSRGSQYSELALAPGLRSCSSNRLLDHTRSLRTKTSPAAIRNCTTPGEVVVDSAVHGQQPDARCNHSHGGYLESSNSKTENLRPMSSRSSVKDTTH